MKNNNFFGFESRIERLEDNVETIQPPVDCYFIHGVKDWDKKRRPAISVPEVSCSIQKDGHTKPLRPYGYILRLQKGAVINAFDRDVTSRYCDASFKKELGEQTRLKKYRNYSENELSELVENTPRNSHNELWVNGEMAEIAGGYVSKAGIDAPGVKAFIKTCGEEGIPVRWVE